MPPIDLTQHEFMGYVFHVLKERGLPQPQDWNLEYIQQPTGAETPEFTASIPDWDIMASPVGAMSWELYITPTGSRLSSQRSTHTADGTGILIQGNKTRIQSERHYLNGQLHREDGAAHIHAKAYSTVYTHYLHGELHRPDGPAAYTLSPRFPNIPVDKAYAIHGTVVNLGQRVHNAIHSTDPVLLARMVRFKQPAAAYFAAHNPACPEEASIEYALTRSGDFPCPH